MPSGASRGRRPGKKDRDSRKAAGVIGGQAQHLSSQQAAAADVTAGAPFRQHLNSTSSPSMILADGVRMEEPTTADVASSSSSSSSSGSKHHAFATASAPAHTHAEATSFATAADGCEVPNAGGWSDPEICIAAEDLVGGVDFLLDQMLLGELADESCSELISLIPEDLRNHLARVWRRGDPQLKKHFASAVVQQEMNSVVQKQRAHGNALARTQVQVASRLSHLDCKPGGEQAQQPTCTASAQLEHTAAGAAAATAAEAAATTATRLTGTATREIASMANEAATIACKVEQHGQTPCDCPSQAAQLQLQENSNGAESATSSDDDRSQAPSPQLLRGAAAAGVQDAREVATSSATSSTSDKVGSGRECHDGAASPPAHSTDARTAQKRVPPWKVQPDPDDAEFRIKNMRASWNLLPELKKQLLCPDSCVDISYTAEMTLGALRAWLTASSITAPDDDDVCQRLAVSATMFLKRVMQAPTRVSEEAEPIVRMGALLLRLSLHCVLPVPIDAMTEEELAAGLVRALDWPIEQSSVVTAMCAVLERGHAKCERSGSSGRSGGTGGGMLLGRAASAWGNQGQHVLLRCLVDESQVDSSSRGVVYVVAPVFIYQLILASDLRRLRRIAGVFVQPAVFSALLARLTVGDPAAGIQQQQRLLETQPAVQLVHALLVLAQLHVGGKHKAGWLPTSPASTLKDAVRRLFVAVTTLSSQLTAAVEASDCDGAAKSPLGSSTCDHDGLAASPTDNSTLPGVAARCDQLDAFFSQPAEVPIMRGMDQLRQLRSQVLDMLEDCTLWARWRGTGAEYPTGRGGQPINQDICALRDTVWGIRSDRLDDPQDPVHVPAPCQAAHMLQQGPVQGQAQQASQQEAAPCRTAEASQQEAAAPCQTAHATQQAPPRCQAEHVCRLDPERLTRDEELGMARPDEQADLATVDVVLTHLTKKQKHNKKKQLKQSLAAHDMAAGSATCDVSRPHELPQDGALTDSGAGSPTMTDGTSVVLLTTDGTAAILLADAQPRTDANGDTAADDAASSLPQPTAPTGSDLACSSVAVCPMDRQASAAGAQLPLTSAADICDMVAAAGVTADGGYVAGAVATAAASPAESPPPPPPTSHELPNASDHGAVGGLMPGGAQQQMFIFHGRCVRPSTDARSPHGSLLCGAHLAGHRQPPGASGQGPSSLPADYSLPVDYSLPADCSLPTDCSAHRCPDNSSVDGNDQPLPGTSQGKEPHNIAGAIHAADDPASSGGAGRQSLASQQQRAGVKSGSKCAGSASGPAALAAACLLQQQPLAPARREKCDEGETCDEGEMCDEGGRQHRRRPLSVHNGAAAPPRQQTPSTFAATAFQKGAWQRVRSDLTAKKSSGAARKALLPSRGRDAPCHTLTEDGGGEAVSADGVATVAAGSTADAAQPDLSSSLVTSNDAPCADHQRPADDHSTTTSVQDAAADYGALLSLLMSSQALDRAGAELAVGGTLAGGTDATGVPATDQMADVHLASHQAVSASRRWPLPQQQQPCADRRPGPPPTQLPAAHTSGSCSGQPLWPSPSATPLVCPHQHEPLVAPQAAPVPPQQQPPDLLCCPITLTLLEDPVVLVGDGVTYSRLAIEAWLRKSRTSPMTGQALSKPKAQLVPCLLVRAIVAEWEAKNT